jgi:hypothetical protein
VLRPHHLDGLLGQQWRLHPLHRIDPQVALSDGPLEEGEKASIAVVGGGRLPTGQLVGDERLDVLAAELAGEEPSAVGLAVGGEQPDGVGGGLDGPRALVLLIRMWWSGWLAAACSG